MSVSVGWVSAVYALCIETLKMVPLSGLCHGQVLANEKFVCQKSGLSEVLPEWHVELLPLEGLGLHPVSCV